MKAVLINYNFTPTWLLKSDLDYLIYDRSDSKEYLKDFPQDRIIYTENVGQVDYDKLNYLVDYYDELPDVFLWGKTNLFKYITEEEYKKVANNKAFTPLLTKNHHTYSDRNGVMCYYQGDMYFERNSSWYLDVLTSKYFMKFEEFAKEFQLPSPLYLPFAPGGNYILTRQAVHKYSRDFYAKLASILPYSREPAEAQMCERSYYLMWK